MSREHGLSYLVCDKCGKKVIHGARHPLNDWGGVQTFGDDGGGPGHVMAAWDLCPACLDFVLATFLSKEQVMARACEGI